MPQNIYDNPEFFRGYAGLRRSADNLNDLLEQPALCALLPPLSGKVVLDLGCGSGGFAAWAARQGAFTVIAADVSEMMLEQARRVNSHARVEYRHCSMENLELPASSIEVAVSSLALHYVEDFPGLMGRLQTWLRPGGVLVFSVEHPLATARLTAQEWIRGDDGQKLFWPVDDYAEEGRREYRWIVDGVIKYHRTLSTLVNVLLESGLTVERIEEPCPPASALRERPGLRDERRRPAFLLVRCRKGDTPAVAR